MWLVHHVWKLPTHCPSSFFIWHVSSSCVALQWRLQLLNQMDVDWEACTEQCPCFALRLLHMVFSPSLGMLFLMLLLFRFFIGGSLCFYSLSLLQWRVVYIELLTFLVSCWRLGLLWFLVFPLLLVLPLEFFFLWVLVDGRMLVF